MKINPMVFTGGFLLLNLLLPCSCTQDFLTKEPPGVMAGSTASSPQGVEAILVGTYSYLRGRNMFGGALCTDWMYGSITSDDCYIGSAYPTYPHFERYEATPSHPYVLERWQDCYNGTSRANRTLELLTENQKTDNRIPEQRALQIVLDPRVDWTIARRGIDFLGWGINPGNDWIRDQYYGGPYMTKKYMHLKSEQNLNNYGSGFYNGKNYRMYRLANILLWRAEIAVEEGDLELARMLVNQIRSRAKYSTPVMGLCTTYENPDKDPVVDWTKPAANYKVEPYPEGHPAFSGTEEALEAVRMEIRLEFATEGHRFFDLRRWEKDDEVLNDFISRDITFRTFMWGAKYDPERNDFWPLPRIAVEEQKGIIKQDSSYLKDLY